MGSPISSADKRRVGELLKKLAETGITLDLAMSAFPHMEGRHLNIEKVRKGPDSVSYKISHINKRFEIEYSDGSGTYKLKFERVK